MLEQPERQRLRCRLLGLHREDGEFIAFWLSGGRVVAGMNVNVWDVTEPIQKLIRSGQEVPVERLTDPDVPLESLLS